MQSDQLDILKNSIAKAVQLIEKLQAENKQLKQYNIELLSKIQKQEQAIQNIQKEYKSTKENFTETKNESFHFYKRREEEIRQKVKELLTKLNTLQQFSS